MTLAFDLGLELATALRQARGQRKRGLAQFAREEIVVPDGPYRGRRFDPAVQPYTGLLFDAIDSGSWRRIVATGPTQSGKTLSSFVIPVMWSLFELGESVIIAAPSLTILADKWLLDILPAVQASRYAERLPSRGAGSEGGETHLYDFGGGAVLRFMAGSGGDKSRAAFTARCVYITETDGMDEIKDGSREADPVTQLEQRTAAYGSRARIAMECTVSTKDGRTWREWESSTRSRIVSPCPHCGGWVCPEREHLTGWKGAADVIEASERARFVCPDCGGEIDDAARRRMLQRSQVLHHGQERKGDEVSGAAPRTDTLGFRWTAWHNLFASTGSIAAGEWKASQRLDSYAAERAQRQFVWALPVVVGEDAAKQDGKVEVLQRVDSSLSLGVAPPWTALLTVGIDVGRHALHWCATAWTASATCHTLGYGVQEVSTAELGEERALLLALRTLRDRLCGGFADPSGKVHKPTMGLVDSGFRDDIVMQFAADAESKGVWWPSKGRGAGQELHAYLRPREAGGGTLRIGDHWHLQRIEGKGPLLMFDANHWKSWLSARLQAPRGQPGAWTVHAPLKPEDHFSFGKHLSAERLVETWEPRKGWIEKWEAKRQANHWLDALVLSGVAAGACGVSALREQDGKPSPQKTAAAPRRRVSSPMMR